MTITYHAGRRIQCLSTDTSTVAASSLVDDTSSTYTVTKSTTGSWTSYSSVGNYTSDLTGNETEYEIRYKLNIGAIAYHGGGSEPRECRHHEFFTENGTQSQSGGTNYIRFGIETVPWQGDGFTMTVGNSGGTTTTGFTTYTNSDIPTGDYWIKIVRDATTVTIGIYSNSNYSTLIEEQSVTRVPTGIRYFKMDSHNNYGGFVGGGVTATVTDIAITTLPTTSFPSSTLNTSQSGSRLEVTDTRKIYYANGTGTSGCKAYYNFEQTSGSLTNIATTANGFADGLGSSADGTNNGATTGSTGKVGSYAWDFTGASDYVTIGDTSTWKFLHDETTSNTISFWVKRSGTQASGEPCILDTQGGTGSNVGLSLFFDTSNNLYYYISDGTGSDTKSSSAITTSTTDFDHLVFVQDWTNLTIYKNGSLIQTIDMTSFSGSTGNSAYALNIGRNVRDNANANFYLDELAIFSRALTSSEISALYNSGTGKSVTPFWIEEV